MAVNKFSLIATVILLQLVGSYPPHGSKNYTVSNDNSITSETLLKSHIEEPITYDNNLKVSREDLNGSVLFAIRLVGRLRRLETNLAWSKITVQPGSTSQGRYIDSKPELEAIKQGKGALIATKAAAFIKNDFCRRHALDEDVCLQWMSQLDFNETPLHEICPEEVCGSATNSPYRTVDGSCNNKFHGLWGKSFSGYERLLPSRYSDGIYEMLRSSVAKRSVPLPSPLVVENVLRHGWLRRSRSATIAVAQWGQFVEHDLTQTAVNKMVFEDSAIECCEPEGFNLSPRYKHPFCAPITVSQNDVLSSEDQVSCVSYVRSIVAMRSHCTYGAAVQLNQATHFLDASQIYGSNSKTSNSLRTWSGGLLRSTTKNGQAFLTSPATTEDNCLGDGRCFVSGDSRVNSQPHVAAIHTIWLREHNRLADHLSILRPDWDDETVFQEARRIVIAEIQHITYEHWLPTVLGKKFQESKWKYESPYSTNVNPGVGNSFATAAMRIFNHYLQGPLELVSENQLIHKVINLKDHFYKPQIVENHLDQLLRGSTTQSINSDPLNELDQDDIFGFLHLDIQRGRDHGLPSYNSFRKLCGLPKAANFSDFSDVMSHRNVKLLKSTYLVPDDVDLLAGGILESQTDGSAMGPVFSCLISDQFLRTKLGDRYFYDNPSQPKPFSNAQLDQLRKVTLARILCDNGNDIRSMQPDVFRESSSSNSLVSCLSEDIPFMNLTLFAQD